MKDGKFSDSNHFMSLLPVFFAKLNYKSVSKTEYRYNLMPKALLCRRSIHDTWVADGTHQTSTDINI
jgi:hypothetical protein